MSTILVDATGVVSGGILRGLVETLAGWPSGDAIHVAGAPEVCARLSGVAVTCHPVGDGSRRGVLLAATRELPRLRRALDPDAVLSFSPGIPGALVRPDVTVLHDLFFRLWPAGVSTAVRTYRAVSYRRALMASRRIACVSERTRHDLAGWLPAEAAKAVVWRPAAADVFLDAVAVAPAARHDVVVPAHNEYKGAGLVVEALDRPDDPHVVLLAGSAARATELTARYAGAPRPPTVLAELTDADLVERLAQAQVVVMASHIEGAGLPVLEALALATPVVVSPDPALVETGAGFAAAMHTWSTAAVREAVADALAEPASHWEGAARRVRGRRWADAAAELRGLLLS